MEINLTPKADFHNIGFTVEIPEVGSGHLRFIVERCKSWSAEEKGFREATVNWSALGSVDVETTRGFVEGLQAALKLAETLNDYESTDSMAFAVEHGLKVY